VLSYTECAKWPHGASNAAERLTLDNRALRAELLQVLRAYRPLGSQQEATRLDFLAHLKQHPDALWKSGPPAHFTASCLVLSETAERVLLTHHRRAQLWLQFGGHFEPLDGSVRAAALREAQEESGIGQIRMTPKPVHLDRHRLRGDFGRCAEHLDFRYAGTLPSDVAPVASDESLDVRWWPVQALPADCGKGVRSLVAAARAAITHAGLLPRWEH
jgi:8-oxo-dGTP pyrophosphatase MutT (NUDIX family)